MAANCPTCDASVTIADDAEKSELVLCPECGSELEITEIKDGKVTLSEAPEEEEDWGQ
jgi:alpha-aminoadipate/glutamate carrier protein LysW